jgi:hypothetical protein
MIAFSHGTPPLLMLGLPYLANNELLAAARRLGAPVPRSGRNRLRRPQSRLCFEAAFCCDDA